MITKQYTAFAVSIDTRSKEQIAREKLVKNERLALLASMLAMGGVMYGACEQWHAPIQTNDSRVTKGSAFRR